MSLHTLSYHNGYSYDPSAESQLRVDDLVELPPMSKRACGVKALELYKAQDAHLAYLDGTIFYPGEAEAAAAIPTEYAIEISDHDTPRLYVLPVGGQVWTTTDYNVALATVSMWDLARIVEREVTDWVPTP